MNNYLTELIKQSESGDEIAQIKLFFRHLCDYEDIQAAAITCDKWMETNQFLEGVWIFYGFTKPTCGTKYHCLCTQNSKHESLKIFKRLLDRKNEIKYYAYNMIGLCFSKNDSLRDKCYNLSAKHGIEYAHCNIADRSRCTTSAIYHYEFAASKYNKHAILKLARLYLANSQNRDPQSAIKYYQNAIKWGYDLGRIDVLLELEKYDIDMTLRLLEYEANRKNSEAIRELASIYGNRNKVKSPKLALDWYARLENIRRSDLDNIRYIIKTAKPDWSTKYHRLWPKLALRLVQQYEFDDKCKDSTLFKTSFQSEVINLLLITKFRQASYFNFTKLLYKNIVLAIIKQLSKIWVTDAMVE